MFEKIKGLKWPLNRKNLPSWTDSFSLTFMLMQIFFSRCHSTSYMTLCFIHIKYFSCLTCKWWIDLLQTFCNIFMYRTLRHSKLFCRLPNCRLILNNIIRNLHRALFDIIFHKNPLHSLFLQFMQGNKSICGLFLYFFISAKSSPYYFLLATSSGWFGRKFSL